MWVGRPALARQWQCALWRTTCVVDRGATTRGGGAVPGHDAPLPPRRRRPGPRRLRRVAGRLAGAHGRRARPVPRPLRQAEGRRRGGVGRPAAPRGPLPVRARAPEPPHLRPAPLLASQGHAPRGIRPKRHGGRPERQLRVPVRVERERRQQRGPARARGLPDARGHAPAARQAQVLGRAAAAVADPASRHREALRRRPASRRRPRARARPVSTHGLTPRAGERSTRATARVRTRADAPRERGTPAVRSRAPPGPNLRAQATSSAAS